MRLLEFLQAKPTVDPSVFYHRIPLFYLGGSSKDYIDYRTRRVFESMMLNEAAIDKYTPAIQVFQKIDELFQNQGLYEKAYKELQWALQILVREDRVTWYMRYIKLYLLNLAANTKLPPSLPHHDETEKFIQKELGKSKAKVTKASGVTDQVALNDATYLYNKQSKEMFAHYFSLNIPKIDSTKFGGQSPSRNEPYAIFSQFEKDWMAKKVQVVNHDEDEDFDQVEKIIEFDDGSAWFNLNRQSCSIEGDAMGHCGNQDGGNNLENELVLSYRVPVDENGNRTKTGGAHWKPRLTFILDKNTGMLGEMKARANTKPKPELHPYIVKLLMSPIVKGIFGGGYKPEANFELSDLGEDKKAEILAAKPELGTLQDILIASGGEVTDLIVDRIRMQLDQEEVEYVGIDSDYIFIEDFADIFDFINDHKSDLHTAHNISKYLSGDEYLEHYGNSYSHNEHVDFAIDVFNKYDDLWKSAQAYMADAYPEEFDGEDAEYNIDNIGDVCTVAMENGEEWYDKLGYAQDEGHRVGAESSMYDTFGSWWRDDDIFSAGDVKLIRLKDTNWDSPVQMVMPTKSMIKYIEQYDISSIAYSGWSEVYEGINDIDEPHYGWDGYDEDVAIEYFSDHADIPTVGHIEVPDSGNATAEHAKEFIEDVKTIANSDAVANMIEKYKTVVNNIELVNGAIVGNVYTWMREFSDKKLGQNAFTDTLKDLAVIATKHEVPFVVRGMNDEAMNDDVLSLGYRKQDNGYLRFDPKGSS